MTDMIWMGLSLVALLVGYPALILTDALRRSDPGPVSFQVLHPVQTGYTGRAPYVQGVAMGEG